jgi:hypothetical protein
MEGGSRVFFLYAKQLMRDREREYLFHENTFLARNLAIWIYLHKHKSWIPKYKCPITWIETAFKVYINKAIHLQRENTQIS